MSAHLICRSGSLYISTEWSLLRGMMEPHAIAGVAVDEIIFLVSDAVQCHFDEGKAPREVRPGPGRGQRYPRRERSSAKAQ